uniref:polycystin family receptor for egg jelly-like n=1 Tax=Myxine glutinosa TaxID=7769 RepID=UPI00358F0E2E
MTCGSLSLPSCFFRVDFEILLGITGVILQGSGPHSVQGNWVSVIDIKCLFMGSWNIIFMDIKTNFDNNTKVVALFGLPKNGNGIQFEPKMWKNEVALRVEILTINWNWRLLQLNYVAYDIEKNVYLQAHDLRLGLVCYLYKPGDGSLYLHGPSLCSSVFSLPMVVPTIFLYDILLKPYIEFMHTYPDYGLYEATLEERSERGSNMYTQIVNVNHYGCSIKGVIVTEDMQLFVSEDFAIFAKVDAQCIVPYDNYEYSWSIEEVGSGQAYVTQPLPYADLDFPALHFSIGTYTFNISVTPVEFPADNITNTVTVQILPTPLVVSIQGGRSKTVSEENDVEVNAVVASYDPDIQPRSAADITFAWSCETVVGAAQMTELCGGQAIDGILVLPAAVLTQGTELAVTVSGSKDGRMTNYTQHLHIMQGEPADMHIRCIDNCESISSSQYDIILLVVCKNCKNTDRKDFQWNLLDDGNIVADLGLHTETDIYSEGLIILPGLLQINKTYEVVCTGLLNDQHMASSSFYYLILGSPSTDGNCSSEQESGIAGVTLFNFVCKGWVFPLKRAKARGMYIIRASNTERRFLLYYSANPRTDNLLLPVGNPTNNYMLDIEMSVCNANYECSNVDLQVQVLPPQFTKSIVHNIITLNGSLWNKVNVGSTRKALGYVQIYATLIPLLDTLSTAEVVSHLLLVIFNSTKQVDKPLDCEQYSLALQYVTEGSPDVLPLMDLISQSVSYILREAEAMSNFYKKTTVRMSEALTVTAGNIVKSMKIFHEQNPNATDLPDDKASNLFNEVYNNILKDGVGVNKLLVPGGKNILLCTASLCVDRDVFEGNHLTEKSWETHFNKIRFHSDNQTSPLPQTALQIVDFRENPLFWNGKNLKNTVVGIQLQNNESVDMISETEVAFNLPLTKRSINTEETISVVRNCTFEVCKAIVKYDVRKNGTMIFFSLEPLSDMAWIEAYIRRDNLPLVSKEAFDCGVQLNITEGSMQVRNCSLMHQNQQRRYFPLKMDNLLAGSYYTLLNFPGSNMTSMISLKVKQVVCMVKNLTNDVWITGWGEVASQSTERRIICLFQQRYIPFLPMLETPLLTIADIFIPPNSIDFSTVFSKFDLANNGVVFGVIVAIVVIYVLLSIWARKKDRRDHLKWTILPLKNADIDNMYIYIITVSTGMHPNASTTSNVFIRFNFEKRTSETFALDNGQFKHVTAGLHHCWWHCCTDDAVPL